MFICGESGYQVDREWFYIYVEAYIVRTMSGVQVFNSDKRDLATEDRIETSGREIVCFSLQDTWRKLGTEIFFSPLTIEVGR